MATRADPLAAGAVGGREGQFVLVEWSDPGGLTSRERPIAGLHVHHSDDEAWYVLEGTLGFRLGDDEVEAGPGAAVFVPRGTPHAFWNAGYEPVRFLELICPGGFEEYFFEMAGPFNARDMDAIAAVRDRYRLTVRPETIQELLEKHGLLPAF